MNNSNNLTIPNQNNNIESLDNNDYDYNLINQDNKSNDSSEKHSILQFKSELMEINNGWNDKNERLIISIGENAASYKWMHERCGDHYRIIQKIMSIILIIFNTGLSAETFIFIDNTNYYVVILRNVFIYIVTIISVLQNFLKYEQLNEKHLTYASNFNKLYHDIQKQMCLYRRDRINATNYVSDILKKYDSFIVNGPNITQNIISKFKKTFKDSNITLPDIADKIQKIEIIDEKNNQQIQNIPNNYAQNITKKNILNINYKKSLQENIPLTTFQNQNYNNTNMCNLQKIHSAFQIHGDITDNDIQNANYNEIKELKKKFLKEKQKFEYQRYQQHNTEFD